MFKNIICSILCVTLVGCTTSPTVWSIGANTITGTVITNPKSKIVELSLIESGLEAHEDAGFLIPGHPYQSLKSINESTSLGSVSFKMKDINWINNYSGKIILSINGKPLEFDVWKNDNELKLKHYYRDWYGYPAQGMLLISYPLDVIIIGISIVAFVILVPFSISSSNKTLRPDR